MLVVKNLPANAGDVRDASLIPGLRRCPGGGHGNPLQYSCLENPIDWGALQATVHGAIKSWTGLKRLSMQAVISKDTFGRYSATTVRQCKDSYSADLSDVQSRLEPQLLLVGVLYTLPVSLEQRCLGEVSQVGGGCEHPQHGVGEATCPATHCSISAWLSHTLGTTPYCPQPTISCPTLYVQLKGILN